MSFNYQINSDGNNLHLNISKAELNLADTLDCGQCFRWVKNEDETLTGIVFDRILTVGQTDSTITFYDTTTSDFEDLWKSYFDLDTDYASIKQSLSFDETIRKSYEYAGGIRILKQQNFEALCSFIISQNNNIPRIKGSIDKLCRKFGNKITQEHYSFPTSEVLSSVTKEDLQGLSLGYRDDYIIDCASKIKSGEIELESITKMDIQDARIALRTIKGVGPKVAECALLFGFYRVEAFPIDTWIKKALNYFYKDGFPEQAKEYAGIAQQYIFHYMRTCVDAPVI